jgi:hypothetical protein
MDVSSLLYTISESASALYKKTLAWQSEMVAQAADTLQQCQNALKRNTP